MEQRTPMEKAFSTDVVLDIIMNHLNVTDLLDCRKVSKFWNKAASSVLRRRSTMIKTISKTKTLEELEECLKQSSDFPFAGLTFDQPWRLDSAGGMRFFENYGARFTRLRLNTRWTIGLQDLATFINPLPRLSTLEVDWSDSLPPPAESSDSAAGQEDDTIINLPSLRILRIYSELNEDVLWEICTATSPSVRIECLYATCGTLRALKNAGKLQAVSVVEVGYAWNPRREKLMVDELLSTELPALTKLNFKDYGCISRKGLMELLISSQHTLKALSLDGVCPSELLSECPVLAKLTTLSVTLEESCNYFFQGSHGHKFPALTELTLYANFDHHISDGLFIVPTVTSMILVGDVKEDQMKQLAQTVPNVNTIELDYSCYAEVERRYMYETRESFPSQIWSVEKFKQLEKLRIREFVVTRQNRDRVNMDRFLTGIPLNTRQILQKQKPEIMQNFMKDPHFGESFSEILRVNPSILQLKNLKELVVYVRFELELEHLLMRSPSPFMSMLSVWFALQMMPDLEVKFVCKHRKPSTLMEGDARTSEEVAMVKAAFKHVQPYVKVEPSF